MPDRTIVDIITTVISLLGTLFGGVFLQHKYHLWNKLYQKYAHWRNLGATVSLAIKFKSIKEFNFVKENLKNTLVQKFSDYRLLNEKQELISFYFDEITVIIKHDIFNEIFIEVMNMSSGINELGTKIETFFGIISEINKNNELFGEIISCDLSLQLPYSWTYVNIFEPNGFKLKDYVLKMEGKTSYKTNVEIRLNKVKSTVYSVEEISFLLGKIL